MRRLLAAVFLLGSFAAAEDCKIHFAVATYSESGKLAFAMSVDQQKWWTKEGAKKYSNLCLTDDPDKADYLMVWNSHRVDRVYMSSQTTSENAPVEGTGTIINNSGGVETVAVSGTARVERTTNTPVHVSRQQGVVDICVRAKDQDGKLEWTSVATSSYTKGGWLAMRSPTKASLENALKLIRTVEKP